MTLGSFRQSAEVVSGLAAALKDGSPLVRGAAAQALGRLRASTALAALSAASRDGDRFAAKWATRALKDVTASAPAITFGVRGLVCRAGDKHDMLTKLFQEAVVEDLLARGRFDVGAAMDFGDDPAKARGVHIELRGEITALEGSSATAAASATIQAVSPDGTVIWEGTVSAKGVAGPPPPRGEDEDEYTIRPEPPDARKVAVTQAGKAAAAALAEGLAPPAEEKR